jgi:hemerythrin-like metal-binding protein
MYQEERKHHRFRYLYMDVTKFMQWYVLRQRPAPKRISGSRTAIHPSRSGSESNPTLARIDAQHEELILAIERFEKAVQEGAGLRAVSETVDLLVRHAEEHFSLEESYMAQLKYPRLPTHREDHARLRGRILYLRQQAAEGHLQKAVELSTQFCRNLRSHTLKEDAAYVEFARSARVLEESPTFRFGDNPRRQRGSP